VLTIIPLLVRYNFGSGERSELPGFKSLQNRISPYVFIIDMEKLILMPHGPSFCLSVDMLRATELTRKYHVFLHVRCRQLTMCWLGSRTLPYHAITSGSQVIYWQASVALNTEMYCRLLTE
jgi:hypothetical protein